MTTGAGTLPFMQGVGTPGLAAVVSRWSIPVIVVVVGTALTPHPDGLLALAALKLAAAASVAHAALHHGGALRLPLLLVTGGMLTGTASNIAQRLGLDAEPGTVAGVVLSFALVLLGLFLIARRRARSLPPDALLDALVITLALLLVLWHAELHEVLTTRAAGWVADVSLPISTVLVGLQSLRIGLDAGRMGPAKALVVLGIIAYVTGDLIWYEVGWGPASRGAYALAYALLVVLGRVGDVATLADPVPAHPSRLARTRVVLLFTALLVAGLLVLLLPGDGADHPVAEGLRWTLLAALLVRAYLLAADRDHVAEAHRTSLAAMERELTHDHLTKLRNRRAFQATLGAMVRLAARRGTGVAVVMVDLDGFHLVNRAHGHDAGDALLARVGEALGQLAEAGPIVGRWGGDVFVVADLAADPVAAEALADRARRVAGVPSADARTAHTVGVGVAWATAPTDVDVLVGQAEAAVEAAKRQGPAGMAGPDETLHRQVLARAELEAAATRALDEGRMSVHYQPIVRLADGAVVGQEALLRWDRADRGRVPTDLLVRLAEQIGIIHRLGRMVLEQVCTDATVLPPNSYVAINASPLELVRPDYAGELIATVEAAPAMTLDRLVVEVTEEALVDQADAAALAATMETLQAAGVRIAVDDFGTGYSGLNRLRLLPVSLVKIDRSFVAGMLLDPSDRAIVGAAVRLARDLGLTVVAEGVETPEQAAVLADLGCDLAQGWHFGRPVPPGTLVEDDHTPR